MNTDSLHRELRPVEPLRALRALAQLRENPDETAHVFTIIEALSGEAPLRATQRLRADPDGQRLLAERPSLLPLLLDREALAQMPRGSLAHAYLGFIEPENITADGLVQASLDGTKHRGVAKSDLTYFRERMRDSHDLWHVVTGYQGDVIGEIVLLAFNFGQLQNPGVGAVVAGGLAELRSAEAFKLAARSLWIGLRAAWLPAVYWEGLLAQPLDLVRARLRIEAAPSYTPLRSRDYRNAA